MKRIITTGFVIILFTITITALAVPLDSLVTRGFLRGAFTDSLRTDIIEPLEDAAERSINQIREMYTIHTEYDFAPQFIRIELAQGNTVRLATGGSFILLSGSASVTILRGDVIDISTGSEVLSGHTLYRDRRYFAAENTTALITAISAVSGQIDGFYATDGGTVTQTPDLPSNISELPFTDVSDGDWFWRAVRFVFTNGFFMGTGYDTFSPQLPMTRGMFVTVLHRLHGTPITYGGSYFYDIQNPAQFYFDAVVWASENNIVFGVGYDLFMPELQITREQMAVIMYRYAVFRGDNATYEVNALEQFPDAGLISDFAIAAMRWASSHGVMRGDDYGMLMPLDTATRAQVAQIIYNFAR